jgi:hypothetical protein
LAASPVKAYERKQKNAAPVEFSQGPVRINGSGFDAPCTGDQIAEFSKIIEMAKRPAPS